LRILPKLKARTSTHYNQILMKCHFFKDENDGKYYFSFKTDSGTTILQSQAYSDAASCDNGIQSVFKNSGLLERYKLQQQPNGSFKFDLLAGNNQVIGTSVAFKSESERTAAIAELRNIKGTTQILRQGIASSSMPSSDANKVATGTGLAAGGNSDDGFGKPDITMLEQGTHEKLQIEFYKNNRDDKFYFQFKDLKGKLLLVSQGYQSKDAAEKGAMSILNNATNIDRYDISQAPDGKLYFDLKAANHQIIGTSLAYSDKSELRQVMETFGVKFDNKEGAGTGASGAAIAGGAAVVGGGLAANAISGGGGKSGTDGSDADRKAAEARRLEREKAEAKRQVEHEKRLAEEKRLTAEKNAAEERRVEAERKKIEAERIAAEKKADEQRRIASEKQLAEDKRIAAEKREAESKRLAEEKRIAAEKRAKEIKLEEKKKAAAAASAAAMTSSSASSSSSKSSGAAKGGVGGKVGGKVGSKAGAAASGTANAGRGAVESGGSGMGGCLKWLLPLLLLALLIFGLMWFLKGCGGQVADGVKSTTGAVTDVASGAVDAAGDAAGAAKDAATDAAGAVKDAAADVSETVKKALGKTGDELGFGKRTLAHSMAGFLSDPNAKAPKTFSWDIINWPFNSPNMNNTARGRVKDIAKLMKEYPNARLNIIGYREANEKENITYKGENIGLDLIRARCLQRKLKDAGVAGNRVKFEGGGVASSRNKYEVIISRK